MALDRVLYDGVLRGGRPFLRLYGWDPPGLSLGRFQRRLDGLRLDRCREAGIPLVRRPTGGRAVLHHRELTYSIASRFEVPFTRGGVLEVYGLLARGLAAGLARLGIRVELAGRREGASPGSPNCFSSVSQRELVWEERKLCGSAQVRERGGFLQQGSILTGIDAGLWGGVFSAPSAAAAVGLEEILGREPGVEELCDCLKEGFEEVLGIMLADDLPTPDEMRESVKFNNNYQVFPE